MNRQVGQSERNDVAEYIVCQVPRRPTLDKLKRAREAKVEPIYFWDFYSSASEAFPSWLPFAVRTGYGSIRHPKWVTSYGPTSGKREPDGTEVKSRRSLAWHLGSPFAADELLFCFGKTVLPPEASFRDAAQLSGGKYGGTSIGYVGRAAVGRLAGPGYPDGGGHVTL
ncbi:hypothetical protein VTK73DRAFT_6604 [Phialemonium thermophilum]|uniref:Uncharacterized protein n=1 Tax=Phialemonium thermophilum TaxID=223376 RepID=A0ABR3WJ35_9PEZI